MMVAGNEVEVDLPAGADGARGGHPPDSRDAAAIGGRHHRPHQGQPAARIAFRVSSKIDSRTVLDGNGAEQLLGKGDMLYLPPASSRYVAARAVSPNRRARGSRASCASKGSLSTTSRSRQRRPPRRSSSRRTISTRSRPHHRAEWRTSISLPAAAAEDRLQPCGAARGHDGSRGPGVAGAGGKPREVLVDKHYFDEVDAQLR